MRKRVLVTGACGFAGRYMCDYLSELRERPHIIATDIIESIIRNCDSFHTIDLSSAEGASNLIRQTMPNYIIHLAGTFGTDNWQEIYKVNVLSAVALLEAIRIYKSDAVVIMAGSAAEYGHIAAGQLPVTEQSPCSPVTSYGLSKFLATQIAEYYYRIYKVCVMVVRPFQLIGKGVTARLAPGAFAKQLIEARKSGVNEIKVGNLEGSRDFLDVRDAVRSIWMLCEKPVPGEIFNLCCGKPVKIGELLSLMINSIEIQIKPVIEEEYLRGNADVNVVYGSYQKINEHCGWEPIIPLQESIKSMFEEVFNEE